MIDFNYPYCFKYVYENDYITKTINRIDYKDSKTKERMEILKNHANNYIKERINFGG